MARWGEEGEIKNRGKKPKEKEKGIEEKCEHRRETESLPAPRQKKFHHEKMRDCDCLGD